MLSTADTVLCGLATRAGACPHPVASAAERCTFHALPDALIQTMSGGRPLILDAFVGDADGGYATISLVALLSAGDEDVPPATAGESGGDGLVPVIVARIDAHSARGLPPGIVLPRGIEGRAFSAREAMADARRVLLDWLLSAGVRSVALHMDGIPDDGSGLELELLDGSPWVRAFDAAMQSDADAWWRARAREQRLLGEARELTELAGRATALVRVRPHLDRVRLEMDLVASGFARSYGGVHPREVISSR